VSSTTGAPVYIATTGNLLVNTGTFPTVTVNAHAVTQGGAWASLVSGTVGVTGTWGGGAVLVTSSVSAPVFVAFTGSLPVDLISTAATGGATPVQTMYIGGNNAGTFRGISVDAGGNLSVSQSNDQRITQAGALAAQVSGTVSAQQAGAWAVSTSGTTNATIVGATSIQVSGSWGGAVPVTSSVSAPVYVQFTGSIPVASHAVTQGGAWASSVSGTVGITQAGALTTQVSGTVAVTQGGALTTQVSGNVGQAGAWAVLVSGTVSSSQATSANATLTTVEVGSANTVLLASNVNRKGATIFSVDATVFVAFGQTPTTTLYAAKVPSSSYYEIPYNWTGAVNAIAAVSGQTVNIQEFTA
jgi:hypothetical protein